MRDSNTAGESAPSLTSGKNSQRAFHPLLLWGLLAVIFVGLHYPFYFQQPFYEGGDLAANALQIRQAKGLHEIYGNYSRFGFHHPGPAFFYAYAAGEWLLFDTLKVVPAPFNAHAIMGVLLQLLFFTWAVWIVGRRVPRPLVVPLLLFFGAFHFGSVNYFLENTAFQSIWPPHVLVMPFLCFLVACASFASGEAKDVVPLALSGSLLVHGHVAQPLFVVPLAAIAYLASRRNRARTQASNKREIVLSHAWAAGIISLFLLPMFVDLLRGEQSNLRLLIHHFTEHSSEHKSFAQSALYYVAFLCHVVDPEKFCDQLTSASFDFLRPRWYFLAMWGGIALATVLLLWVSRGRRNAADRLFARWLAFFLAAASALTLVWGKFQTGAMFEFNGHFNFAILFLPFILLAIAIASLPSVATSRMTAGILFALSLPLMFFASRNLKAGVDFPTQPAFSAELHQQIQTAARSDRQTSRTKLLLFEHDQWGAAVQVALELERMKYRYRVDKEWELIFGRGRGVQLGVELHNPNIAVWRVGSTKWDPTWLQTDLKQIDPADTEILFSTEQENAHEFVTSGWDISNGPFSWSVAKSAVIRFSPGHATSAVRIVCDVAPSTEWQPLAITFNAATSKVFGVTGPVEAVLEVPAEVWNAQPTAMLKFDFPEARSPLARGISADARELGCAFTRIRFSSVQ